MKFTTTEVFAAAILAALSSAEREIHISENRSLQKKDCTFMIREDLGLPEMEKGVGDDHPTYDCMMDDGSTLPLILDKAQEQLLDLMVKDGSVTPGEDSLQTSSSAFSMNGVELPEGVEITFDKKPQRQKRRKLVTKEGDTYYLVVRVIDQNGLAYPHDTTQMSDNMFGTGDDIVNLKSQISACSAGKLNIVPGYPDSASQTEKDAVDAVTTEMGHPVGFMEATIDIDITTATSRYDVRNAVISKVHDILGFTLPGPFDHVVFNLEGCYNDCGWAAYAYINSWNQVYQSHYYYMPGVLVHEYGHNLGMAHSGGLDQQAYTDHTCMMGNPLYDDEVGRMCFNPAKSYYIGWYEEGIETFDPSTQASWSGTLMGVGEWEGHEGENTVVVKIETGTNTDFFVGFNRAAGANAQNDEADDLVTIIETGNNGISYSQSYLKGYIGVGEKYTFTNWQGSGQDLAISVGSIDTAGIPGTAVVSIATDGTPFPTPAPTPIPGCSSDNVQVEVTTDNYPQETSWKIENSNGELEVESAAYSDANYVYPHAGCHNACGGKFVISDTYGDGMCCSYGSGEYSLIVNGQTIVRENGDFGSTKTTPITCTTNPTQPPDPTELPTPSPTKAPSNTPPTSPPTKTPSNTPPTSPPTNAPSNTPPTSPPTKAPSNTPPTSPPTKTPSNTPPTSPPTKTPSNTPPTSPPTKAPSNTPPTSPPTNPPSNTPPTSPPTKTPSNTLPTSPPTKAPSDTPLTSPPTKAPSDTPLTSPTKAPSDTPLTSPPTKASSDTPPTEAPSNIISNPPPTKAPSNTIPNPPPTKLPSNTPPTTEGPSSGTPVESPTIDENWIPMSTSNDFEDGDKGVFIISAKRIKNNTKNSHDSGWSMRIKKKQKIVTTKFAVQNYRTLKVEFWYFPKKTEDSDKLYLQTKFDGESWKTIATYGNFNNDEWLKETAENIDVGTKNNVRFRFKSDQDDNNDKVYIDDVNFFGME